MKVPTFTCRSERPSNHLAQERWPVGYGDSSFTKRRVARRHRRTAATAATPGGSGTGTLRVPKPCPWLGGSRVFVDDAADLVVRATLRLSG